MQALPEVVVAYSKQDPAGSGISLELSKLLKCEEHVDRGVNICLARVVGKEVAVAGFEEDVLYFDFLDKYFEDANYFIVVSRHSAASGISSLTVHHTGNPTTKAEYGGKAMRLAVANPPIALSILRALTEISRQYITSGIEITYEVTHHGPTELNKPITFAEIGSSPAEWSHKPYQEIVAKAVYIALSENPPECISSVGIGGGHYAHQFTERVFTAGECYGHILSRHVVKEFRDAPERFEYILRQAVMRSAVTTKRIVLEGKTPSYIKQIARSVANNYGLELLE